MYDISLTMPAIRTNNWVNFYNSAKESCKNHSFEVVIVSPFDLPDRLKGLSNILHIIDRGNPSRATQIANISARGKLIMNCVDDGVFTNNALDWAVDYYDKNCQKFDVINLRYRESKNREGQEMPLSYWKAWSHGELVRPGIHPSWDLAMHFIMLKETYINLGGIDCQFEYSNHGIHDLIFRLQYLGGKVHHSPMEGLNCSHYYGHEMDHGPINDAQTLHDAPIFCSIYNDSNAASKRTHLYLNNWMSQPEVWERRFNKKIEKYEDLL